MMFIYIGIKQEHEIVQPLHEKVPLKKKLYHKLFKDQTPNFFVTKRPKYTKIFIIRKRSKHSLYLK